ncbi:hypothetical protein VaNZ11_008753 [Volvox africanus]|uniref:Uncharacterized protein n=1 Tax=Volvox africanus TaxID=51714 RepID=A0ABQ5S751_9CHLO|nr:hypothetical protein VaNZ11_008753 [Volvox africanus]
MAHPPPLPRTAARLSICVDFPGYLQLIQGPHGGQCHSCLLQNQTTDGGELPNTVRPPLGSETRCSADFAASSIFLPGYARGSHGASRRARGGAATSLSKQRKGQPGSVDGAAGAVLLCSSGELTQYPVQGLQQGCGGGGGQPQPQAVPPDAEGSIKSPVALRAAAAAAATSAAAVAVAMIPPRLLMLNSRRKLQAPLQADWSFDSDLQRARLQARCAAASSSRCQIRYEECGGGHGGSGSHLSSCSSRSSGDFVDRKRGGNDGGNGKNSTRNPANAVASSTGGGGGGIESGRGGINNGRGPQAKHVPVATAATAWSTVTLLTGKILRTIRYSSTAGEGSDRDRSVTSRTAAGISGNGAEVRQAYCDHCTTNDSDRPDPREPSTEPCRFKAPQRPRVGGGGRSLTPTPSRCRILLGRTTSAPSFVGVVRQGDGGGEVGGLVTATSSISSRSLESSPTAASTALNGTAGPSASAAVGDAAFLDRLAGRRDHRPRFLREWMASLPWLGCGHGHLHHVSRASFGYDKCCGVEGRSATAPSFTALDCLEDLSPGGGRVGGCGDVPSGEMGGVGVYGRERAEALTEPLPKCAETYRLRAALACGAAYTTGASERSPSAPTAFTDSWAANPLLTSADSRGGPAELVAVAPPPLLAAASSSVKRNRPSRLGSIWPSTGRPAATCG